jgi:hypothetical protein
MVWQYKRELHPYASILFPDKSPALQVLQWLQAPLASKKIMGRDFLPRPFEKHSK